MMVPGIIKSHLTTMAVLVIVASIVLTVLLPPSVSSATPTPVPKFRVTGYVYYCGAMATSGEVDFHYPTAGNGATSPKTYVAYIQKDGSYASPELEYHPGWQGSYCIKVGPTQTCTGYFNAQEGTLYQGIWDVGYWVTIEGQLSVNGVPTNGITVTVQGQYSDTTTTGSQSGSPGYYSIWFQTHGEKVTISASSGGKTVQQSVTYDPYSSNSKITIPLNIVTAAPTATPSPTKAPTATPSPTRAPTPTPTRVPAPSSPGVTPGPSPISSVVPTLRPTSGVTVTPSPNPDAMPAPAREEAPIAAGASPVTVTPSPTPDDNSSVTHSPALSAIVVIMALIGAGAIISIVRRAPKK